MVIQQAADERCGTSADPQTATAEVTSAFRVGCNPIRTGRSPLRRFRPLCHETRPAWIKDGPFTPSPLKSRGAPSKKGVQTCGRPGYRHQAYSAG
jgi:hypothetical protein